MRILTEVFAVNKFSFACLFIMCLHSSAYSDAEPHIGDPTKPLGVLQNNTSKKNGKFELQGIYRFESDLFAIVNNIKVGLGESIGGGVVKSLNSHSVVIEYEGNFLELSMRKSILKKNGKRP